MPKVADDAAYLAQLQDYYARWRVLPAYGPLQAVLGLASRSAVAKVLHRLQAAGYAVVLTAAPSQDEKTMVDAIQARLATPAFSLSGQLSLKELAALTQAAKLFIGVDSAPMHIAAAVGTPTVALFGPSGDKQWGPWGVPCRVVSSCTHPCRPCGHDGCGGSKVSDCLVSISVDEVLAAAQELLPA